MFYPSCTAQRIKHYLLARTFNSVTENLKIIFWLGLFFMGSSSLFANGPYVDYSTFATWVSLVPEERSLEVCGLTRAAHDLWSQKQLRVPESTFIPGEYSGTGRKDWIVPLHQPKSNRPCDYVLIVTENAGIWERLFLKEIQPTKANWSTLWFSKKQVIGIDNGERRRRTGAAEMQWSEGHQGKKGGRSGFVVEDALIDTWIEWNKQKGKYNFKKINAAEWWEIDQE
jgi:hypothetical protein